MFVVLKQVLWLANIQAFGIKELTLLEISCECIIVIWVLGYYKGAIYNVYYSRYYFLINKRMKEEREHIFFSYSLFQVLNP